MFFDLETTGLSPRSDRIIEIAGLRVATDGEVSRSFHSLVQIDASIPPQATAINGITDAMLRGQPSIDVVLPQFIDFVEDLPLVSYNVSFDMGFLTAEARRLKRTVPNVPVCALQVARRKLPRLANHRLKTVAAHLGLASDQNHRALDDCRMGLEVFARLMQK